MEGKMTLETLINSISGRENRKELKKLRGIIYFAEGIKRLEIASLINITDNAWSEVFGTIDQWRYHCNLKEEIKKKHGHYLPCIVCQNINSDTYRGLVLCADHLTDLKSNIIDEKEVYNSKLYLEYQHKREMMLDDMEEDYRKFLKTRSFN